MDRSFRVPICGLAIALLVTGVLTSAGAQEPARGRDSDQTFQKETAQASPSFDQKKWMGTQNSYETFVEDDFVGGASQNLGNGQNSNVRENYFHLEHDFRRHTLLAFLVQGGLEYEDYQFGAPNDALFPDRLDTVSGDLGVDF